MDVVSMWAGGIVPCIIVLAFLCIKFKFNPIKDWKQYFLGIVLCLVWPVSIFVGSYFILKR